MKPVALIDFGIPVQRRAIGAVLLMLAAPLLGFSAFDAWRMSQDNRDQAVQVRLARHRVAPPPRTVQDGMLVAQARVVASQLSAPWDELLAVFEEHSSVDVGLLRLEPDARASVVRVTGQAGSLDAMLGYFSSLEADPRLVQVVLLSHQTEREVAGRPVSFTLTAAWRRAPLSATTRVAQGDHP